MQFISPLTPTDADKKSVIQAHQTLDTRKGQGNDFLGWIDRPTTVLTTDLIDRITKTATRLQQQSDIIVVAGIGGSYLGAKAVIDAFADPFAKRRVVFAGHTFDTLYHEQLLHYLDTVDYSCIIISKSGTTLETKTTFEQLLAHATAKYGQAAKKDRFITITDTTTGLLRAWTQEAGCESYDIPSDIGGRYSVFTACGLLPIACGLPNVSIESFVRGAADIVDACKSDTYQENLAMQYALTRYLLHTKEKKQTEILVPFVPNLSSIGGRRQQLYGESDGKDGKGLLPISLNYSTDLHSMGQYVQDGPKNLFETFIRVDAMNHESPEGIAHQKTEKQEEMGPRSLGTSLRSRNGKKQESVSSDSSDSSVSSVSSFNLACYNGTLDAHRAGGVPVLERHIENLTPHTIGAWLYVMMKACGLSGYLLGVNPFNQPGVEAYKTAMRKYIN